MKVTVTVGLEDLGEVLAHCQVADLPRRSPVLLAYQRLRDAWHAKVGVPVRGTDHVPANPYLPHLPDAEFLTRTDRAILDAIVTSVHERGYPPSVRELGGAVGLASTSSVQHRLLRLERLGYITRDASKPRALTVVHAGEPLTPDDPDDPAELASRIHALTPEEPAP